MASRSLKAAVVVLALAVGLLAYVPANAEFMPEEARLPHPSFPLLPPLIAIALAIATRQVLPALFAGVWVGALIYVGYDPLEATRESLSWIVDSVTDSWNATILLFDFVIGAFVGVLYASGALHSVAESIARRVRSARTAGLASWLLGLIVFFDDYTNTVVVGNTMRPIADRNRVSRELLSYIVDSTAAPIAGIALVSTWIGFEVSLIQDSFTALGVGEEAYSAWLKSVPYRFYSILAIILVFLVVWTRRHFGPMLEAELRAVREGLVLRPGARPLMPTETVLGAPPGARRAPPLVFAASIAALILVTIIGLIVTGAEYLGVPLAQVSLRDAFMNADAATALLWGSFAAYLTALALALAYRSLDFDRAMEYTVRGMYLMVYANAILVLAWSIKAAVDSVGTAAYVVHLAVERQLPATLVPLIVFLASMFISFTTGTSWGTFSVMMPIAIPLAYQLASAQAPGSEMTIVYASIAAVFAGGIYGDHCSPISDTTIMSSMFTGADHIDHVNTQLPYATLAAGIGILLYLLFAAGLTTPLALLPLGIALLVALHRALNEVYARRKGLPPVVPDYKPE